MHYIIFITCIHLQLTRRASYLFDSVARLKGSLAYKVKNRWFRYAVGNEEFAVMSKLDI